MALHLLVPRPSVSLRRLLIAIFLLGLPIAPAHGLTTYPKFEFEIRENSPKKTHVGSLFTYANTPTGITASELSSVTPHMLTSFCENKFEVDQKRGAIVVQKEFDRERMCAGRYDCKCRLRLILKDNSIVNVNIKVLDVNDHVPRFTMSIKAITISENAQIGYEHTLDLAVDPDLSPFNVELYSIDADRSVFGVHYSRGSNDLKLILKQPLDHEKVAQYNGTLHACDGGSPRRCGAQHLVITVKDENDNGPVFEKESYVIDVPENLTVGALVTTVRASDADSGENGRLTYSMRASQRNTVGRWFYIDDNGNVYLKNQLSFKEQKQFDIRIDATDHGASPRKKTATLVINVKDLNNHAPKILIKRLSTASRVQMIENKVPSGPIAHVVVMDNDDPSSPGGKFSCMLTRGEEYFELDLIVEDTSESIYKLQPTRSFNREDIAVYRAQVTCQDHGAPPMSAVEPIDVFILDENEAAPYFMTHNYTAHVPENRHVGEFVLRVEAKDPDAGAMLRYALDNDGQQYFRIEPTSGDVYTKISLDREQVSVINFGVVVTDAEETADVIYSATTQVRVIVLDSNDNVPKVTGKRRFWVEENTGEGRLDRLEAKDPDAGSNGHVVFKLLHVRTTDKRIVANETFRLLPNGDLFVQRPLDREQISQYILDVLVHDEGSPQQNTSTNIVVNVKDQNDNPPIWTYPKSSHTIKNLTDLVKPGHVVTRVAAIDADVLSNVTYRIGDDPNGQWVPTDYFHLDLMTGKLRVASLLKPGTYPLLLVASDNGDPVRTSTVAYTIHVVHRNPLASAGSKSPMNFTLIVAMIAVTCVICISLLIAIFVVRRRTLRTRQPKAQLADCYPDESLYPSNGSTAYPLTTQTYYPGTPMTSFGQQEKLNSHSALRGLPADMEVASADSGHGASEEENGQQSVLAGVGLGVVGADGKPLRADYRAHLPNARACPILPEDSVIQCGCGDTLDLSGNSLLGRSHHGTCAMGTLPAQPPPAYTLATSGGGPPFRTFPRHPRTPLNDGSGSIDGSLSRLCHSPQTNV